MSRSWPCYYRHQISSRLWMARFEGYLGLTLSTIAWKGSLIDTKRSSSVETENARTRASGKNSRTLVSSRVILKFEKLSTDRNIIITRAGMCLNDTSSLCFEDEFLADLTFSFSFVIKRQSLCQESEKKTHTCHVTQFKFN